MNLTSTAQTLRREPVAPTVRVVPELEALTDHSRQAVAEERRWLLLLLPPFLVGAAFFAAAVGTGLLWLMGPALVLGPGLLILAFVYLGLTSDLNDAA
jgi:hypothetical protein